jgi:hypothetical protein
MCTSCLAWSLRSSDAADSLQGFSKQDLALYNGPSAAKGWASRPLSTEEIKQHGQSLVLHMAGDWASVNPFWLTHRLGAHTLTLAAVALIAACPVLEGLGIDYACLVKFLLRVEALYTHAPYHNVMHALHVLLATHCLLTVRNMLLLPV